MHSQFSIHQKKKARSVQLIEQEVRTAHTLQVIVYVRWNALLFQVVVADRHMDRFFFMTMMTDVMAKASLKFK
jgi:hypothetical protein